MCYTCWKFFSATAVCTSAACVIQFIIIIRELALDYNIHTLFLYCHQLLLHVYFRINESEIDMKFTAKNFIVGTTFTRNNGPHCFNSVF